MDSKTTSSIPQNLMDALDRIPESYEVSVRRKHHNGGWWMCATRKRDGGEFQIVSQTKPTWQEAFAEIWRGI